MYLFHAGGVVLTVLHWSAELSIQPWWCSLVSAHEVRYIRGSSAQIVRCRAQLPEIQMRVEGRQDDLMALSRWALAEPSMTQQRIDKSVHVMCLN